MSKRIFLDDINQAWVSIDLITGLILSNDYNRDLYGRGEFSLDAMYHAKQYWKGMRLI